MRARRDRDRVLTTGEAAGLCNVSRNTVNSWADRGRIAGAYRLPDGHRDRRIPVAGLIAFMKAYGMPTDQLEGKSP